MAGTLGRISSIFKAKMNATLDAAENPNEMIDYSYDQMLEQQRKVRAGIVDVAAAKARLQMQLEHIQQDSGKFDAQASQALAANREDLARLALSRKADAARQLQSLQTQIAALQTQQEQLQAGSQRLDEKIQSFNTHKETIKAQYSASQAQVRISEAASGLSEEMADVNAAIQRAGDKTEAMQARANALGELTAAGTLPDLMSSSGDDLQAQLDQISSSSDVDAELAELKAKLGQGAPAPKQLAAPAPGLVVRVQGSGQYRLAQAEADELHALDHQLTDAVSANDSTKVHALLGQMIALVQTRGKSIGGAEVVTSQVILPPDSVTVEEVHALMHEHGLVEESTPGV
ncbi:MAG TPA: PspA/IM30 family protein [Chloroflexota bacterium]|nr:PspA/IM30 family protein [Chloroflexota bacterium]